MDTDVASVSLAVVGHTVMNIEMHVSFLIRVFFLFG